MIVKSMRGEAVDLAQIAAKNEHIVAVGNARMNTRGDRLGRGGVVAERREDIARAHYNERVTTVTTASLSDLAQEAMLGAAVETKKPTTFATPAEAVANLTKPAPKKRTIVDKE